jgi:hypothetical protein
MPTLTDEHYSFLAPTIAVAPDVGAIVGAFTRFAASLEFNNHNRHFGLRDEALYQGFRLYSSATTVRLHTDRMAVSEGTKVMGLIVFNEVDQHLQDTAGNRFPLSVGSVFRLNPNRKHGTCLADGHQSEGRLVFISGPDEMDTEPSQFAATALKMIALSPRYYRIKEFENMAPSQRMR